MKDFINKVAVVTGGASGIGLAIAELCVQLKMKVVLADIEEPALLQAERRLKAAQGEVLAVKTDVSKYGDLERVAQKTLEAFGAVHLLFNNAGVGAGSTVWESSLADWQWVIGVNLWGVINGIKVFMPILLAQDTECYIVNTASLAGLISYHPSSPYHATKHAVVAISENLHNSLSRMNSKVHVSVICPGWVKTQIMSSERNRPAELQNDPAKGRQSPESEQAYQDMLRAIETGITTQQVAEQVFSAIRDEKFYILTHPEFNPYIQERMKEILQMGNPT